jgi:DNA replication initiation complex subunit (GINS family)
MEGITTEQALEVLKQAENKALQDAEKELSEVLSAFCEKHKCNVVPTFAAEGNEVLFSGLKIKLVK